MGRQVPSCRAPFPAFPVWILFTLTCPLPHVNLRISVLVEKRGADQLNSGNTKTVVEASETPGSQAFCLSPVGFVLLKHPTQAGYKDPNGLAGL